MFVFLTWRTEGRTDWRRQRLEAKTDQMKDGGKGANSLVETINHSNDPLTIVVIAIQSHINLSLNHC